MRLLKWVTPNQLTMGRILVIPLLLVLVYRPEPATNYVALVLFILACLTDYYDGYLARFRGEVSPFGKLMDPLADKMLITASLVMLVYMGIAGVIPTLLILMREFAVSGLRQVAAAEGVIIAAVRGAKYNRIFQMVTVGFLLLWHDPFSLPMVRIGDVLLWVSAAWTLWTGYDYFRAYFRQIWGGNTPPEA